MRGISRRDFVRFGVGAGVLAAGGLGCGGHEFMPTRDPLEGLRQAVALCNG